MRSILSLFFVLSLTIHAVAIPVAPLLKFGLKTWDDAAKVALKVSGKSMTDDAIKATAKTLEKASAKYGDDVLKQSLHGGVEVSEQALRHGSRFITALKLCPTGVAARNLALHSDEVLKLSAKYGDDIIRLNSKIPGLVPNAVNALKRSNFPVKDGLNLFDAGLKEADLPRIIGALERTSAPEVQNQFLTAMQKGGSAFIDKIFAQNAKQIMAGGVSTAMITAAIGGGVAAYNIGNNLTTPSRVIAESVEAQQEWALQTLDDPNATPENREHAEKTLNDIRKDASDGSLGGLLGTPLKILATSIVIFGIVWIFLRHRARKETMSATSSKEKKGDTFQGEGNIKPFENREPATTKRIPNSPK